MQLPNLGEVIANKYRIEEVLGEGGFGCVYRGLTLASGRAVAIKVLKPSSAEGYALGRAQRFMREMRAVAQLQSPYTLTLFDCGQTDDGLLFMVTEFIDGDDLNHLLATKGRLTERETAHLVMQILLSLAEAHRAGILHRDIKPSNIRIFEYGPDPLRAKLLDFGLARSLLQDEVRLTGTGNVIGTPRYMSPEQLVGEELTPASDIYSLGLVARECVLGRTDVTSAASREIGELDPVSPAFRDLVNAMLEFENSDRPADAHEVYERFRARLPELDAPEQPPAPKPRKTREEARPIPSRPSEPRSTARSLAKPLILVVAVALVLGVLVIARRPAPAPPPQPVRRAPVVTEPADSQPDVGAPDLKQVATDAPEMPDGCRDFDGLTGHVELELSTGLLSEPQQINVYVPKGYRPGRRHPLLIAFRDFRTSSRAVIRRSRLNRLADNRNVLIVAPKDSGNLGGVWESRADMQAARDAVEEVKRRYCVDESKVFAFGHGMGGRAIELVRCELPGVVAVATTGYRREKKPTLECDDGPFLPRISFDPQKNPRAPVKGGAACGLTNAVLSSDAQERELRDERRCSKNSKRWLEHENGTCREWACDDARLVTCRVDGGREFNGTKPREWLAMKPECDGTPVEFPYTKKMWEFFMQVAEDE